MTRETKTKNQKSSRDNREQLSIADSVRILAAHDARADLNTEEQLILFLKSWWSRTYNRPLKDPLLETYTLEELLYEFYDKIERRKAEEERIDSEADKIEDSKEKADLDWAEQEEKRELEVLKANAASQSPESTVDPTKDPVNVAWMEEQINKAKELLGESFGEDIEESFE
jgi:hypothetical protein